MKNFQNLIGFIILSVAIIVAAIIIKTGLVELGTQVWHGFNML